MVRSEWLCLIQNRFLKGVRAIPLRLMKTEEPKSFARRDHLVKIQQEIQKQWHQDSTYFNQAPQDWPTKFESEDQKNKQKFYLTFPYPYMNGRLHLGHAFSLSKCEFAARFQKMKGKDVLWPFAFHCTGMPIAACADRLKRELAENIQEKVAQKMKIQECEKEEKKQKKEKKEEEKKSKKGEKKEEEKEETKDERMSQYEIMLKLGVPPEEIPKFSDAKYWLEYFPPRSRQDLQDFGICVDWRRSFITTDVNPFYDRFIRWQFNTLKARDKLQFGKRNAIYSIIDQQPCADHDRTVGEEIRPEEFTLIKIKILEPLPEPLKEFEGKYSVFLPAATLRPETMYGQTNCYLLPEGEYGVYKIIKEGQIFVCSARSALNMAFQEIIDHDGSNFVKPLLTVKGKQLIGIKCKAPLTKYPFVYTLPMPTISMKKGTGVVTSVPSDSPDDYAMLRDLQKKKGLREKLDVDEEWVKDFQPIPIIEIPGVGNMAAEFACEQEKVQSHKDAEKLKQAKQFAYKKGFYEGKMIIGVGEGLKVEDAKPLVRKHMIENNLALSYSEPESLVISRQGEECVVALVDQWLLKYGEEEWRDFINQHVKSDKFTAYSPLCQTMFEDKIKWLKEWGCSRTYGLGTRIPWDEQFLIESLSDSTIYMAYYTISHLIQGINNLNGQGPNPAGIKPEDMTHEVFDYIYLKGKYPEDCNIPEATLAQMRNQFEYWYPMDLRASGKDLIPNHLTMSLYNHAAIWEDQGKMPRSFFCNGYIQVDGQKMSKNKGNFLTLRDCLDRFGADATRFTCADSGDSLDDSNFETMTANSAILKLFVLQSWINSELEKIPETDWTKFGPSDLWDAVALHEINTCIKEAQEAYQTMRFRDALKSSFFDMQSIKDDYVLAKLATSKPLNPFVVIRFIETQLLLLHPICPHLCSKVWSGAFKKCVDEKVKNYKYEIPSSIEYAFFPEEMKPSGEFPPCSGILKYWHSVKRELGLALKKVSGGKKKGKGKKGKGEEEQNKEKEVISKAIFIVAKEYPEWQKKIITSMMGLTFNKEKGKFEGNLVEIVKGLFPEKDPKKIVEEVKFAKFLEDEYSQKGSHALDLETQFNEFKILSQAIGFILAETPIKDHIIISKEEGVPEEFEEALKGAKIDAIPGHPYIHLIK